LYVSCLDFSHDVFHEISPFYVGTAIGSHSL
jgi:hypothetical protein